MGLIGLIFAVAGLLFGTIGIRMGRRKQVAAATVTGFVAVGIAVLGIGVYYAALDPTIVGAGALIVGAASIALALFLRPQERRLSGAVTPMATGRTNGLALASIIVVWFSSVIGLVLGHIALNQIKVSGDSGRGMALTAVVVGWAATAITVVLLVYFFAISQAAYR